VSEIGCPNGDDPFGRPLKCTKLLNQWYSQSVPSFVTVV